MKILERHQIKKICDKYDIKLLVLFGSQATGESRPESDIDLAILFPESADFRDNEIRAGVDFMEAFQSGNVELVVLNRSEPLLLKEVASTGIPLYEKEKGLFDEYQLLFIKKYLDTYKFRMIAEERLNEFLKKRGA